MLLTKTHTPSPGKNLVQRDNLSSKLNQGLKSKLILISAPAGFGKTTLLSEWINKEEIPTAWFSISKGDNDPVDFLSYIILSIQGIKKGFGQSALELLKSPNAPNTESIINLLINEIIEIRNDFLLVLDDFHSINNSKVIQSVAYLLENIPNNIHVVILTRSDPALPIARIRSQHQLVEIRSADLSFSANEISILFNKKLKIKLSIENSYKLEEKTEGWLAGLHLTALSIPDPENVTAFIDALKGDNRFIMDYLMEEVMKIQSDDVKEFLLQTSILEQISAPLCNAVLNRTDSQEVLEGLEKSGMFLIPLDTDRHWYRYHHLFADLLKQRLSLKGKSIFNEVHEKACSWFLDNNLNEQAIQHALEVKNYEKSIQILGGIVENMWENGLHSAIMKFGEILPDELIKKNPEFCLYYSWILITSGQIKKAEPFIESSEKITRQILADKTSSKELIKYNKKNLGKIAVAFAYLNSNEEHSDKIFKYCEIAMQNLSDDDPFWCSWAWFSNGIAHSSVGDIHKSRHALQMAWNFGEKTSNIYLLSTIAIRMADSEQQLGNYKPAFDKCLEFFKIMEDNGYSEIIKTDWSYAGMYSIMAGTYHAWAEPEKALENVKIAYQLSEKSNDSFLRTSILMQFCVILIEHGDSIEASKKIDEAEELNKQSKVPPYLSYALSACKLFCLMDLGEFDQADALLEANGVRVGGKITYVNETIYIVFLRFLLLQNRVDEAETILSELHKMIDSDGRVERLIEIKMSYAILYEKKGLKEKAIENMIEAIKLAENQFLVGYLTLNLERIDKLLHDTLKTISTSVTNISKDFIDNLKAAIERKKKLKRTNVAFDLTDRERETLVLIAEDLMNQEIADKLFISLNTVKTRLKNIFLKLDVDSRTKAAAKAKEFGLIQE